MNTSFGLEERSIISTSSKSFFSKDDDYLNEQNSYSKANYENSENFTSDKVEKCEDNFKLKKAPSEFSDCRTDNKFSYKNSEEEKSDNENEISLLNKKTKRKKINCNDDEEDNISKKGKTKKYRREKYIKDFKTDFLLWVLLGMHDLIDKCKFCKKFGKTRIHKANRKLYGGNAKEEDNREFINKAIEEVFTSTESQKNSLEHKNLQDKNKDLINKIKVEYKKLLIKKEKDRKYLNQFNAIKEFIEFIQLPIKDALDMYYDSEQFQNFKSRIEIQYYDKKFYSERKRDFSLLEKNNFVVYVNSPFWIKKRKAKK